MTAGRSRPFRLREQGLQQRGLARAGRADHVEAEDAGGVEPGAVLGGELVVGFEDLLGGDDFHGGIQLPSISMLCRIKFPAALRSRFRRCRSAGHSTTRSSISGPGVAGVAAADGLRLLDDDFGVLDHGAGRQQPEGEADRLAVDAREPADAQLQPQHPALLARPIQLSVHLVDQGLDDGKLVHGRR